MLEKKITTETVREIEFNWERVKKKATDKREKLVSNNPNILKRNQPTSNKNISSAKTSTTDLRINPYTNIQSQVQASKNKNTLPTSTPNPISGESKHKLPYTNIDIPSNINEPIDIANKQSDTLQPELLPRASAQQGSTSLAETSNREVELYDESLGPERNAVALLQGISEKSISGKELTTDERRLVVKSMKELGQTQDAIAELLTVSRRTIVSDYKVLRQEESLLIQKTETSEIAGEVYSVAKTCIRRALQAGHFKTVSVIMRDMVEVLQSLGIIYRAPKTSMAATMHGQIPGASSGYQKYMGIIGEDKTKVVEVLDCMFNAIDKDEV